MKNSDYWKRRFTLLEQVQNGQGAAAFAEIEKQYMEVQNQLEGQIARWYQQFGDNNNISLAQARQYLNGADLKDFMRDVRAHIKYGRENGFSGGWMKELEKVSARFRVSKLDALKIQTRQCIEDLFSKQYETIGSAMSDVFESGFYHTAFELQKGFGVGWDIAKLDKSELENILAKPWAADGKNFSERIWANKEKLISEIHNEFTRGIMTGQDPQKVIGSIAKKLNVSKSNAARLVMTEQAYFGSAAQGKCFEELGVEQYEILATLDSHTSDICQGLDGKVFPLKDFQAGVTAPPFHVRCRSTTAPCFEDGFAVDGSPISEDLTYEEWESKFVKSSSNGAMFESGVSNNWDGASPTQHTKEELDELVKYAEEHGIRLYKRQPFDGDISLLKSEIDTIEKIRNDFNHTDFLQIGWKKMSADDFGETSANHQEIWINSVALYNRGITEKNLSANNYLATNTAEGIAAHEMGHVISGKLKKGITGLDIYKQTVYNVSGKMISDEEAVKLLKNKVSKYSVAVTIKDYDYIVYDEIISEMLSVHYTKPNKYSEEFVKLLKGAMKK